ncbi:MAG: leucine-rich repeat protein [Prevotella sp.]
METSEFITINNANDTGDWYSANCIISRETIDGRVMMRKQLRRQFLDNGDHRDMLRKEYAVGSLLAERTPYIVGYRKMTDNDGECSIWMDYIEGETVDSLLAIQPDYFRNERNLRRFLLQLLEGLEEMHACQVVHMDIKPANVMLTSINWDVRIIDLGLSYTYSHPTSVGMTDAFAAPEQKEGGSVDARTDIYAVGKMIEYIANKLNSEGRTYHLPRDIRRIMEGCLYDDKERRWQSCGEIIRRLNRGGRRLWIGMACIVLIIAIASAVYVESIGGEFIDGYGMKYEVLSRDSGTCAIIGRKKGDDRPNIYISDHVKYRGRTYTVTEIADSAFKGDMNLVTVCFPSTLRRIGAGAFKECKNMISADIPDGVSYIGPTAFWWCEKLESIHLPKGIRRIPMACFSITALREVSVPEGVESIGFDAFAKCDSLTEVGLPNSLRVIERGVFWQCHGIRRIEIPASVEEIGQYNFLGCTSLEEIRNMSVVPQDVIDIFDKDKARHVRLEVPSGAVEAYRRSVGWNKCEIVSIE